jgi:dUTP pyrophosphatase
MNTGTANANNPNLNSPFRLCDRYMQLTICVSSCPDDLKNLYHLAARNHNAAVLSSPYYDAGFDLFAATSFDCSANKINMINFDIKCEASMVLESGRTFPTGFHLLPRSSMGAKTPLRLANSVGVIDSGYRGPIKAALDSLVDDYKICKHDKLVQLCAPGLVPVLVEVTESLSSTQTARGLGGFGSTTG